MQCSGSTVQRSLTRRAVMQSVYSAIPYALSPVLGNPLAMAAVNVDRTASLPTQVHLPLSACPVYRHPQYTPSITFLLDFCGNSQITGCCHAHMGGHQVARLASNKHVALLSRVRQVLYIAGLVGTQCVSQLYMHDGLQAAQYVESLQKLIPQLGYLSKILPPAVLQWKLELLKQGNAVVKGMLPRIQQRVFLLTADGDLLIPSKEEGPRLQKLLPRCRLKVMVYGIQLPASGIVVWRYWHCF